MTAKTAYTAEQSAELVAAYQAAPTAETVATFAEKFGKSVKSVVAKLSREGVYQKKEYTTKAGTKPVKKEEMAERIFALVPSLTEPEIDSLVKANKGALAKVIAALEA